MHKTQLVFAESVCLFLIMSLHAQMRKDSRLFLVLKCSHASRHEPIIPPKNPNYSFENFLQIFSKLFTEDAKLFLVFCTESDRLTLCTGINKTTGVYSYHAQVTSTHKIITIVHVCCDSSAEFFYIVSLDLNHLMTTVVPLPPPPTNH